MNKHKIILILLAIFVVLGSCTSWYSYNRNRIIEHNKGCDMSGNTCMLDIVPRTIWEVITDRPGSVLPGYIPARFGPANDVPIPCSQMATTTDCNKISDTPSSTQPPIATTSPQTFSFGSLINVYEDKQTGFTIKYPTELKLSFPDCASLNDRDGTHGIGIKICKQGVGVALNEKSDAKSLTDFSKNYIITPSSNEPYLVSRNVAIKNNEEITTDSGTKGFKQSYETWSVLKNTGEKTDFYSGVRYVFFSRGFGAYFIYSFTNGTSGALESTLMKSVTYK